jgi:hypothetical protein
MPSSPSSSSGVNVVSLRAGWRVDAPPRVVFVRAPSPFLQYNFVKQDVYTRDTVLVEVHALMYYSIFDVRKVTARVCIALTSNCAAVSGVVVSSVCMFAIVAGCV